MVAQALEDLLQHVRQYTARGEPIGRYDQATDTIMTVTESIFSSMGDAGQSRRGEAFIHCTLDLSKRSSLSLAPKCQKASGCGSPEWVT